MAAEIKPVLDFLSNTKVSPLPAQPLSRSAAQPLSYPLPRPSANIRPLTTQRRASEHPIGHAAAQPLSRRLSRKFSGPVLISLPCYPATPSPFRPQTPATQAKDVPSDRDPIVLKEDMAPSEAFHVLSDKWVRACPVMSADGTEIIGTLDLRDACKYFVRLFKSVDGEKVSTRRQASFDAMADEGGLSAMVRQRPFISVEPDAPLMDVATALSGGSHIVGVKGGPESTGGLSSVITQGGLFKMCVPVIENLSFPVSKVMKSPVISVKTTDPALKGFEVMVDKGISAIAVCDPDGAIVHNTSTSDVKLLFSATDEDEVIMNENMENFLVHLRSKQAATRSKTKIPVSTCQKGDAFGAVIKKLAKTGYHHVWVVNVDRSCAGVVSLTDVFRKFSVDKKDCTIL